MRDTADTFEADPTLWIQNSLFETLRGVYISDRDVLYPDYEYDTPGGYLPVKMCLIGGLLWHDPNPHIARAISYIALDYMAGWNPLVETLKPQRDYVAWNDKDGRTVTQVIAHLRDRADAIESTID